ncbi:hypothetical protein AB835_13480 [Candidatus Endobugula sertula]|uniref:DUF2750 domain-containing protein n=1 Tax=Candidatus Endobugula sertula TaxID=62101 RepID=A0A1D2QLV9_9GAMM|nr:hypothetical protein AB835_13480 [Candidatus Endobugula sertula]
MGLLSNDHEDNYHRFFEEAMNMGCIWSLQHDEGWALCASEKYKQADVIPFWSQPEFAECHIQGDWQEYKVVAISLEEFMDDWLTGMHTDIILVGINWDAELKGEEYEPLDVLHTFESDYLP